MNNGKKLSTGAIVGIVIAAVALILVVWGVGSYNSLVSMQQDVKSKESSVQVAMQKRADLIPNLVNTVKGYAKHEETVFKDVSDARAKLAGASNVNDLNKANSQLDSAISRLLVVVEQYPNLKANQNFIALQDELSSVENEIKQSRMKYNTAAQDYNSSVLKFPKNIIANMFGFKQVDFFKAAEAATTAPSVSF